MKQLSDKQKQLIQLLSDGSTQKEIASSMGISSRRVEKVLHNLRKQFSCSNNEKLVKLFTQAGHLV